MISFAATVHSTLELEHLIEKISAEKTRSLAVKIGRERGAGIYLDTRCEKRQSFSIAEIKNILYLLSEGYEEVNFEFDPKSEREVDDYGWSVRYSSGTLKIKNNVGKRVDGKCQIIGDEKIFGNYLGCTAGRTVCNTDEEQGYQVFAPDRQESVTVDSVRFNLNVLNE
ncbi:unnamed protein product [Oikopleura dioica]|uniref:Uncharacterized protein n=1 Tax=Oikopleura dioica TaxID=34765 RepID=E4WVY4_OIKDI|nr:unnamed protein product [Oikopleura dioica]